MNNLELVKKPRLGSKIYVVFHDSISKVSVYMKGKDSFCHNDAFNDKYLSMYRQPLRYDDYGKTWFSTLSQIAKYYEYKVKFIKVAENYWEIVDKPTKTILEPGCYKATFTDDGLKILGKEVKE